MYFGPYKINPRPRFVLNQINLWSTWMHSYHWSQHGWKCLLKDKDHEKNQPRKLFTIDVFLVQSKVSKSWMSIKFGMMPDHGDKG